MVIDNLPFAIHPGDESHTQHMVGAMMALDDLRSTLDYSVLMVQPLSKIGGDPGLQCDPGRR